MDNNILDEGLQNESYNKGYNDGYKGAYENSKIAINTLFICLVMAMVFLSISLLGII